MKVTDNQNVSGTNAVSRRKLLAGAGVLATSAAMAGLAQAQSAATPDGTVPGTAGRPRVALVTGSSRGIGAATARQLGRDGYRVVVNCVVSRDLAAQVARDIEASGSPAIWRQADVRDPAAVRALFDAGEEAFGGIDVVVANAGVMHLAPFADMSDEDVNHMFDVNILGSFHTLREAARRVRDGGRIFALSSTITRFRTETYGPYAASKMAQELYATVLAKELAGRNISVNAIAPGVVNTTLFTDGKTEAGLAGFVKRTPYGRLGEPNDIANVISLLCSGGASWVNGQVVYANGGIA
ncbi:SDR family oxidoreductase [Sinorhizobium meliloti]|uniref:SDR family oxidoreductase n=1 Tax=Rhizobium meliloti TaxID=382 RepID=UPI000FD9EC1C|nr:SDR family oxidoreductase [Sinorhizobium meliloti]RVL78356.1 SDR family oxidoreductase [Sinorhizobium meliloti]